MWKWEEQAQIHKRKDKIKNREKKKDIWDASKIQWLHTLYKKKKEQDDTNDAMV